MSTLIHTPRLFGQSFVVYYGYGPLDGTESFDIAILDPDGWPSPVHHRLQTAHVQTLAYLSPLEVPPWREAAAGLSRDDFIKLAGRDWVKEPIGNKLARPDSPQWRRFLSTRLDLLYRQRWSGLFLDTLGDVEDEALAPLSGWLMPAVADLVRLIRGAFPGRPIIVNNGLWRLVPLVAPYIDGVCWEANHSPEVLSTPGAQAMLEFLGRAREERGWVNLMLTRISGTTLNQAQELLRFYELADRYGFLSYAAPADYAQGIRLKNGRIILGK